MSRSLYQQSEMLQSLFLLYVQVEVYQNILKLSCWPFTFTLYEAFLKNKKTSLKLVFLLHFLHNFRRQIFLTLFFVNRPNFIAWLSLLLEILNNMCIDITCCRVCDVMNFEINLSFLVKLFFYITKNSGRKYKYLKNKKSS